jgi:hypothetical protein
VLGGANGVEFGVVGFGEDGVVGGAFGLGGDDDGVVGCGILGAVGGAKGVVFGGVPGTALPGTEFVGISPNALVAWGAGPGPNPSNPLERPVGERFVAGAGKTGPINSELVGVESPEFVTPTEFSRFVLPAITLVRLKVENSFPARKTKVVGDVRRKILVLGGIIISTRGCERALRSAV